MYNQFAENAINHFVFEYSIKDPPRFRGRHLGNSRVMPAPRTRWFSDLDGNGQVNETEIIQVEHYYPFACPETSGV